MSKITRTTVKKFIRENKDEMYINIISAFDGMIDGCEHKKDGFKKAEYDENKNSLGIKGAWFVGSSRDYFDLYEDSEYKGIEVSNSCGCFVLAVKKQQSINL